MEGCFFFGDIYDLFLIEGFYLVSTLKIAS